LGWGGVLRTRGSRIYEKSVVRGNRDDLEKKGGKKRKTQKFLKRLGDVK